MNFLLGILFFSILPYVLIFLVSILLLYEFFRDKEAKEKYEK